jgi:hypothetical protein
VCGRSQTAAVVIELGWRRERHPAQTAAAAQPVALIQKLIEVGIAGIRRRRTSAIIRIRLFIKVCDFGSELLHGSGGGRGLGGGCGSRPRDRVLNLRPQQQGLAESMRLLLELGDLLMGLLIYLVEIRTEPTYQPPGLLGRPSHREILVGLIGTRAGEAMTPGAEPVDELTGLFASHPHCLISDRVGSVQPLYPFAVLGFRGGVEGFGIGQRPQATDNHRRVLAGRHTRRRGGRYQLIPNLPHTRRGPP